MRCFLLAITASYLSCPSAYSQDARLRLTLENVYSLWRQAMIQGDAAAWKRHTAAFRQASTHNLIVSQKKPFPETLFEMPMTPPNLAGLTFLQVRQTGSTASAIYYGRVDFNTGEKRVPKNLLVVRFIKEREQWKYDELSLVNLASSPEVRTQIEKRKLDFLTDPSFQPASKIPPVPPLCPRPDYVADIHLISLGYASDVTVNGVSTHRIEDDVRTELVIGGLQDGKNRIQLRTKPLAVAASGRRILKISVHVKTGDRKNPAIKVYEFKPADPDKPLFIDAAIWANEKTLDRYAMP